MEYNNDTAIILESLNKDKRELTLKLNEIDKLIKKIKYGNLNLGGNRAIKADTSNTPSDTTQADKPFPIKADLKVQVIKIMDLIGVACKLSDVRDKYKEITGFPSNLRETLRNLNKHQILKLIQPKNNQRGLYWIKAEWLEDDGMRLKDQHKFDGFDLLYTDDMIEFK